MGGVQSAAAASHLHETIEGELSAGEVLRGLWLKAGLSQDDLHEVTGVSRLNISALENGRLQMTSHYAILFGAAFKAHPADILFPNRKFEKTAQFLKIEKKAEALLKNLRRAE